MAIIVGIDEAGYGPKLGPLTVAFLPVWVEEGDKSPSLRLRRIFDQPSPARGEGVTGKPNAFETLPSQVFFERLFSEAERSFPRSFPPVRDSKKVYHGVKDFNRLEQAVWTFLDFFPQTPKTAYELETFWRSDYWKGEVEEARSWGAPPHFFWDHFIKGFSRPPDEHRLEGSILEQNGFPIQRSPSPQPSPQEGEGDKSPSLRLRRIFDQPSSRPGVSSTPEGEGGNRKPNALGYKLFFKRKGVEFLRPVVLALEPAFFNERLEQRGNNKATLLTTLVLETLQRLLAEWKIYPIKMNFQSGEAPHPNPPPKRGRETTENPRLLGIYPTEMGFQFGEGREGTRAQAHKDTSGHLSQGGREIYIFCGKHGGRAFYRSFLNDFFPGNEVVCEGRSESIYSFSYEGFQVRLFFLKDGEDRHRLIALASLFAKYRRELSMRAWNAFWQSHLPALKATAGYGLDARRFWKEIDIVRQNLKIPEHWVWRKV